jgi:NAD(P)-dependent dehydrogenase (short-subunit alcohol dehydrogenase family)
VVVVDVHQGNIDATLRDLREIREEHDAFLGLLLDVRDEQAMESMARLTIEKFGRIDALVACAGILRGTGSSPMPLARISTAEWEQVLDTNLKGMFLSNRAVLPAMIRQRAGDIINISSVSGRQGRAHDAPYCASKFGVIGMSESLAEEVRGYGIRVQIVLPDAVDTPMWNQNGPVPCPPDALPPERVAELIVYMLRQPPDTMLLGVTIAPFRARRRKKARSEEPSDASSTKSGA